MSQSPAPPPPVYPPPQMQLQPRPFVDLPTLLRLSAPRAGFAWARFGVLFIIAAGVAMLIGGEIRIEQKVFYFTLSLLIGGGLMLMAAAGARGRRSQFHALGAAAEMVQTRRWPEAAVLLQQLLMRPSPNPAFRAQALVFLGVVMARYHQFDAAIAVYNHLLEHETQFLDPAAAQAVRAGRAMAMLREDHLFDADRAISEMRRIQRAGAESADPPATMTLVEMYRDVKTGHPDEAIALFESQLPTLRDQLSHRVADCYALAAKAYDQLSREAEAKQAYHRATLLAPWRELHRRYPELQPLLEKYQPSPAPPEAA